jgi:hypothetical protein
MKLVQKSILEWAGIITSAINSIERNTFLRSLSRYICIYSSIKDISVASSNNRMFHGRYQSFSAGEHFEADIKGTLVYGKITGGSWGANPGHEVQLPPATEALMDVF